MIIDSTISKETTKKRKTTKVKYPISNGTLKFMNHTAFLEEDCIQTRDGLTDYLLLENFAIRKESEENQLAALQSFVKFFRSITSDIKLIFMGYAANTKHQIDHLYERSKDLALNEFVRKQRDHKIWELSRAHEILMEDIVYIQIFGKTRDELERTRTEVVNGTSDAIRVNTIPIHQKKELLYQLYNLGERSPQFDDSLSDEELLNKAGEDRKFMSEIKPESGIMSKGNWFSTTGRGYIGVYHLHRYAKKEYFYWGESIFRQPGIITTVDLSHLEVANVKRRVNKAIGEKEDNAKKGANREIKMEAAIDKHLLEDLLADIIESNESIKEVTVRYYISGKTKETVQKKAKEIDDRISARGYKASFFLGEEDRELCALFCSQTVQREKKNRRGQELTTTDLGSSYPLNHSQLIDPNGLYFGNTSTNGLVVLDLCHKDMQRLSYGFTLLGVPRSGKSSTLKKIGSHNDMLGNYTYYFMANAENDRFMHAYGGLTLDASGTDGTANLMQIFAVVVDELTGKIDEVESYNVSLSKVKTIYATMNGTNDPELSKGLGKHLDLFYKKWFKEHDMRLDRATQYPANHYPLLEDFGRYIHELLYDSKEKVRDELSPFEANRLDKIDSTTEQMLTNGTIFNRYTSIDVSAYRSVSFNLMNLLNKGKTIFNAQLYNLLFLVWNLSMVRGMREKNLVENGEKTIAEVLYSTIIFDEFHNITRQENEEAIDLLDRFSREAPKAFGGLGIATHDISDLFSEAASSTFKEKVYNLLKLSTYTFIMKQDAGSTDALKKAFKKTLTESELDQVPNLNIGETILCIKGKGNIQMKIDLSKEEISLFTGGH